jgi:DNA-binding CsgD family transcriptional regulator
VSIRLSAYRSAPMARLSRTDLEAALAFAAYLGAAAPERARCDEWILARLAALIGIDSAGYYHLDAACETLSEAEYGGPFPPPSAAELAVPVSENPFCRYAKRTGDPYFRPHRLSDVVDLAAFARTHMFAVYGADPAIQMRMPGAPTAHWTLDLARTGPDFSDRDLLLLDAVRPALVGYEAYRAVASRVAIEATTPGRDTLHQLSRRENEVLDLVAEGASNTEIGVRLSIAPGTVKKHLENIFGKLDVGSRVAALSYTGRTFAGPAEAGDAAKATAQIR